MAFKERIFLEVIFGDYIFSRGVMDEIIPLMPPPPLPGQGAFSDGFSDAFDK